MGCEGVHTLHCSGMCLDLAGGEGCAFVGSGFLLLRLGVAGVRGFLSLCVWASVMLETAFCSCKISSACFTSLLATPPNSCSEDSTVC